MASTSSTTRQSSGRKRSNKTLYTRKSLSNNPKALQSTTAFFIFLASALFAASFAPIQDCDEVFNYWEPSHYLNHGYGLQTWEYSPVYAIRSWTYAGIHSIIIYLGSMIPLLATKSAEFYFLRIVFGVVCAASQTKLFSVVSQNMNPRIAIIYLIISVTSPGMFHASTAYLPSSFAMYTTMLGTAAFADRRGNRRTAQGIMWFGIGATLGWPFAAALVFPFLVEEAFIAIQSNDKLPTLSRVLTGAACSSLVLVAQTFIDVGFYRKLLVVPLNIVLYNVFGGSGKGPDIYGTEPWHFYLRNLALNFNIWLLLALISVPLVLVQYCFHKQASGQKVILPTLTASAPFYLWLAIFTLQPHKEERFMYPVYPLLALNAAIALHIILHYVGSADPTMLISKIPSGLRFAATVLFVITAVDLGFLRTAGVITAYSAPLQIYSPLNQPGAVQAGDTVCLGKEWYRFPSSYFLPQGVKAKFIKSNFAGLLPGEFSEAEHGSGFFPGTWLEPAGMNDENKEDAAKYTDITQCAYLVDSYFPNAAEDKLEPHYMLDTETWDIVKCMPFLDTSRTSSLGRMLWIPELPIIPERFRRKWGQYCLLKRKGGATRDYHAVSEDV